MDRELDAELRFHVDMETGKYISEGVDPETARRRALLAFGGVERFRQQSQAERGTRWLDDAVQDARHAVRALLRTPGFTLAVLLTLALGIGANTAIFSVVNGVLLRAWPWADPDRLVMLWEADRFSGTDREQASVPDFNDIQAEARTLSSSALVQEQQRALIRAGSDPERVSVGAVSHGFFQTLGITPVIGRDFRAEDDQRGSAPVAVISEDAWRSRFGGREAVIGSTIRLDDLAYEIVGVVPSGIALPAEQTQIWVPFIWNPETMRRWNHVANVIARTAAPLPAVQHELTALSARLEQQYEENRGRSIRAEPLTDVFIGSVRPALLIVSGAVAVVLLIACANIANLLLARTLVRKREIAVRSSIGATRARLIRQFFTETFVLTFIAAIVGIGLARALLALLVAIAPAGLPRVHEVHLDAATLAVTTLVMLIVTAILTLVPAFATREKLQATLQTETARATTAGRQQQRMRSALVAAQLAFSVLLLVCAGLLVRSFWNVQQVSPGFRADHLLKVEFNLPDTRYPRDFAKFPQWPEVQRFQQQLIERTAALPGVKSAALAVAHPMSEGFTNSFVIVGREAEFEKGQAEVATRMVSPDYFTTVGVPLLRGRMFDKTDDANAPAVIVINQAMADRYFPGIDPIGQEIRFWGTARRVVGVVGNERFKGLMQAAPAAVYPPLAQAPIPDNSLLLRTTQTSAALVPQVRAEFRRLDPAIALYGIETMDQVLAESVAQQRFTMLLLGGFALLALVLASIGVHGVISYLVAQRRKEMGVRLALGASARDVVRLLVRQGAGMSLVGIAAGAIAAFGATRLLRSLLFGIAPRDPVTFVTVPLIILATSLLASYLPARRAARIAPVEALRSD